MNRTLVYYVRGSFIRRGIDICEENLAENLVISMDATLDYEKLTKATRAALHANKIIVCNEDKLFPQEDGLCPGCGAIVSAILYCTDKKPDIILGKPMVHMLEYVSQKFGYISEEMVIIGDSVDSDIKMAEEFKSKSILIGTSRENGLWVNSLNDTCSWDYNKLF